MYFFLNVFFVIKSYNFLDDRSISTSLIESHPRPPSVSEGTTSALYTELQKTAATTTTTTNSSSQQPSPLDGADSGIGSDSPKQTMAPPVPPKPRRPSSSIDLDPDDPMRSAYEDSTIGRDHSVLPASIRPSSRTSNHNQQQSNHRASSPAESTATGRSATPRIEPDLVAKDRYDPSSKCFSYVPAKALKEHYTAPKKPPTSRRQSLERSDLDIPTMDKEALRNISITPTTELIRRAETPKWDSVVDKIAPKIDLPDVRKDFRQLEKERYNGGGDYFSKTLPNGYIGGNGNGYTNNYEDEFEKPVIVDQAKKAPPPRRRGRYGSYSTTNDDYNSDMDDLMDPEFYLSYSAAPTPPPDRFASGSKSVELPRKQMKTISQRDLDEIDSIIESTTTTTLPPARSCYTPKPEPPRPSAERDAFRLRNCRSVNSGPTTRKLFSNERYDSITDADTPDDWLKNKLRTLHSKRGGYPDAMQRKNTEKKLLEELKNANPNNQLQKGEYVSEGIGQQQQQQQQRNGGNMNDSQIDLIEEYQKEEERLRNTRSPFTAIDDFRSMNRAQTGTPNSMIGYNGNNSRYGRGTTPTTQQQIIRSKPPTPPPRERSKSPTIRSPQPFRKSQTPSAYQQERSRIASTEYLSDDDDDTTEFSHLHSLVNDSNNKRAQTAEPSNYYSSSNGTGTKSILKRGNNNNSRQSQNGTPISYADSSLMDDRSEKKDIYASPVPSSRRFGGTSSATRTASFGEVCFILFCLF
uniref:Uncharacterized protein n=1 Tax=Panagrolaimus superbus TaxID=310955 RepID=A0A914YVP8_9BILA